MSPSKINLNQCNYIQTKIYQFLQAIPVWKVVTYKIIADKFGIHPRMVARILATNQNPDTYPCYKVICNNGKIGWYNLGIDEKIRRLERIE